MTGSVFGGGAALLYFLIFQICGILLVSCLFREERFHVRAVVGSTAGSVLLMWLPVLFSFFFGFSLLSHILALLLLLVLTAGIYFWKKPQSVYKKIGLLSFLRTDISFLVPAALWTLYAWLLLHSFRTINGEIWSSQCTYGDMSMHFGFITSIAEQKVFPPEYSILPGVKLSYPFLSDSISSSLYLFGASLQLSYFLPMLFAGAQVFFGAWLFFSRWLKDPLKAAVSELLFFLNGGFGFAYFLGDLQSDLSNFTRIFTAFYETPTNLVDENIRWVNVIVDMLVPQRATLFGWSVLFPLLYVLYRAVFENRHAYFIPAAVLAGGTVMIHTHSFLALGLICGIWLFFVLANCAGKLTTMVENTKCAVLVLLSVCIAAGWICLNVIQRESPVWLWLVILCTAVFLVLLFVFLIRAVMHGAGKPLLLTWGAFFAIVLLCAVPQLLTWTFTQVNGESFLRGWYNWANLSDGYLWFYIVNLGLPGLLILPALLFSERRIFLVAAPASVIWFICEFVVFQPNTYDNNKLLYAAYLLLCGVIASYSVDIFRKLKDIPGKTVLAALCVVLCTVSAVLTITREGVAEYCLFGKGQYAAAEFISENTEPEDTILTDMRHNNEIAALTGRNIVCGSTSYVYFHGLDYMDRMTDIELMYKYPESSLPVLEAYGVDYIMVSAYEINNYEVDEDAIKRLFPCVYDQNGIRLYDVSKCISFE